MIPNFPDLPTPLRRAPDMPAQAAKPAIRPAGSSAGPPVTAAEAFAVIAGWCDLSDSRRRDLASGLRTFVRLIGQPAEAVRLEPRDCLATMERASPDALGIAPSTLANHRACVRFVLRRLGYLAPQRARTPDVCNAAWASLLERLPKGHRFGRLRALISFCVAEGIAPDAVGSWTLDRFAEARHAERGGAKARDHARRAGVQWNLAAREIARWPATRLGQRPKPNQTSLPFSAYPESLQRDIEGYLSGIGAGHGAGLFQEEGQTCRKPVAASTVTARKYCLRRLLWGAVQSGVPVEQLTSLRQVTESAFIKASLSWHHRRAGEVNDDLAQLAATIASVAKHLDVPSDDWAAIKPLLDRVRPLSREGLTDRVEGVLQALDEPMARAILINLPEVLMKKATRLREGWTDRKGRHHSANPVNAAWLASAAVAIEILLHVPLRIRNLQELRIGQELRLTKASARQWRGELSVNYVRVKNRQPLSMPLGRETIDLLREYLEHHRGNLPNASTNWLFPGEASHMRPRDKGAFGQAITEVIQDHVGVRVHPHAFRAFAGLMILEADQNGIDDIRAILGHTSFETALTYYRRQNQRAAAERLSSALAGQRRNTRSMALSYLMAPELRRRRRRLP